MATIKHTKNELKAQREALKRFQRYLPTLQLKKQQLQLEVRQLEATLELARAAEQQDRAELAKWVRLFAEPVEWKDWLSVRDVRLGQGNIAGVAIPVLAGVDFSRQVPDLFTTPAWLDDALDMLQRRIRRRLELQVLEEQLRRLAAELRTTSQRVNLFEKVKIPEAREHIRVIRIFLGDQMTAGVARSKMAKAKAVEQLTAT
ncbi:V-type ATP synthase subunit D [Accumulibacter sp.]|uniref:V-type ATP synthase subunit D n=1 Tax=Accumulibacter sp. TaxID=2053492 RepID=UPI0025D28C2F|nr:V-type ATP synthase subunit D [Accumulibacter sp.]MCM8610957.1 V-type ATP synthase subunit D [Accumulibacter sp.]MCM8634777.1 V-type ATP synthase subunit D [Accumulibacter sp.]MCM8638331.1 V-type ATP synthase subunit D [Accumulibacter sp.]